MKYFRHLVQIKYYIVSLFLVLQFSGYSQSVTQQLRLANALEKNQEYESALKIYKNLENNNTTKSSAIQGIQNCLKGMMKYDELILYMENLDDTHKSDDQFIISLSEAYLLKSKKEKARELWYSLLNKKKNNIRIYRMVVGSMLKYRLFDDAVKVYELALQNIKNQNILHLDLANLYRTMLNMEKAAEHFLEYYANFPKQQSFLQRQLLNLTNSDEHLEQVAGVLKKYIDNHKDNKPIKEILAGLYIKSRKFDLAYDIFNSLENTKKDGSYLFKFGKEAQKNNAYDYAIKSFNKILEIEQTVIYNITYFELANTYYKVALKEININDEPEQTTSVIKAIKMFENLVSKNSLNSYSDLSCFALSKMYLNFYFDLDKTIYYYNYLIENYPKSSKYDESLINLGDAFLIKGDLEKSKMAYTKNVDKNDFSITTFKLAELEYYKGNFSNALNKYNLILKNKGVSDSLANNALERTILINSFLSDTMDLKSFAYCEMLKFQNKFSEAVEHLNKLLIMKNNISPRAGKCMVEVLVKLKKYPEANNILKDLIEQYPEDYHVDEFLFKRANIEEILGNLQSSFELYQQILNNYETSLYYEQARERARTLSEMMKLEQVPG
jgi:tetratricopeptide (TPR) repeat protein